MDINHSMTNAYIEKNHECSKKIGYKDLSENEDDLKTVFYEDLQKTKIDGFPVASDFVDTTGNSYSFEQYSKLSNEKRSECRLRYFYLPNHHELIVGTTGSGKTTGCIEPQLRAVSSQRNKPNLFITDPKGELYERNAKHLVKQGYKLFALNFKEPMRSNRWNPLLELYDLKVRLINLTKNVVERQGKISESLQKMPPFDKYNDVSFYEYNGFAFPCKEAVLCFLDYERGTLEAEIDAQVNQLATTFIEISSQRDPCWEQGAQNFLKGILHALLENIDKDPSFTRDMMTIRTIYNYYSILIRDFIKDDVRVSGHFLTKNLSDKVLALMSVFLDNANNTKRNYFGTFDTSMKDWFLGHIFTLTSGNDIDIGDDGSPFAIFLITRDYDKSDFTIAGLFIDWIYKAMIKKAEKRADGKNPRATHFMLDEFGNIPEIKDFENKIATARSRNLWFHLIVQSYKQLEIVYNQDRAVVIRDNCNSQYFLGAQNRETKELFSKECGMCAIPTLSALHNELDYSLTEVRLVPVSQLDLIKPGEMFIKRVYKPVFVSRFIRSYQAASIGVFENFSGGLQGELPYCFDAFDSPECAFIPKRIEELDNPPPNF